MGETSRRISRIIGQIEKRKTAETQKTTEIR